MIDTQEHTDSVVVRAPGGSSWTKPARGAAIPVAPPAVAGTAAGAIHELSHSEQAPGLLLPSWLVVEG